MKTKANQWVAISITLLIVATIGCQEDDSPDNIPQEPLTFEKVIDVGVDFEPFPTSRTEEVINESEPIAEDYERSDSVTSSTVKERFICTTKTVSVQDGNSEFPLFNANADVIYPGGLLQGKTLEEATPAPIVVKRAGGTLSYDLNNGNLSSSFTVDEVRKSTVQDAMNNIINGAGEVVPANFQLDIIQVESESQLALEMGLSLQTWTKKVSSNMSFSTEKAFNRSLVKITQSYYTMSFDLPTSLEEVFDASVTPDQLATYVQEDNPATFISSVTYGRIFYMLIESTSSRQDLATKLNIAYGAFRNKAGGELGISAMKELDDLKIKVIAYGGDAKGTFQLTGETNINDIATKLGESTDVRAGLPLSYVVRSVKRPDQIVGTSLATQYDVVECELKGVLPPGLYRDFVDLFDDGIGALAYATGSNVMVFDKSGTRYAWFSGDAAKVLSDGDEKERKIFDLSDPAGPLGGIKLSTVGAAVEFSDNRLYIFDKTGFECQILPIELAKVPSNSLPTGPIGTFVDNKVFLVNALFGDSDNFFIGSEGLGAGVRTGSVRMAFFGTIGDTYQIYDREGSGSWSEEIYASTAWFLGRESINAQLFDKVGAATSFELGGSSLRYLFVNQDGDQILEWFAFPFAPDPDRFEGPWVIN